MKVVPNQFSELFERFNLEPKVVNSTCFSDGMLFVATDSGLMVLDENGPVDKIPLTKAQTIGGEDGTIIGGVGAPQLGRHRQLVVEVGKRAIGIERAGVEYRLSGLLDFRLLLGSWISPREVVVDDSS